MGKILSLIHMSLDGYMADAEGQISWVRMDAELASLVAELWRDAAGTMYGRTTYQMMDPYWPNVLKNPGSHPSWHLDYAQWVDRSIKVVVSKTLSDITWNNTRLISDNVVDEVRRVKKEVKGNLLLLASATLVETLLPLGLIDECWVTVHPVVLGGGKPFFKGFREKVPLTLLEVRTLSSGVVGLHYQVDKKTT